MKIQYLILLVFFSTGYCSVKRLNLDNDWSVSGQDSDGKSINVPAIVPGGIYSDLMNNDIIDDIYAEYGDIKSAWVGRKDWTYTTTFSVSADLLELKNINLIFNGLDTVSRILLNDKEIGASDNMFVRYIFDVKDVLVAESNNLTVAFKSPVLYAQAETEEQSKDYVVPPLCVPDVYQGECGVNEIRKMQSSFSWDWGPSYPSSGIWKEVFLKAYDVAAVSDIIAAPKQIDIDDNAWLLDITVYFNGNATIAGTLVVNLTDGSLYADKLVIFEATPNEYNEIVFKTNLTLVEADKVQLWWPNGYGEQPLYNLTVTFYSDNKGSIYEDSVDKKVGFRTVELIQDEIQGGLTFYFKINNKDIFAKGSNAIPLDIIPEKGQDPTVVSRYLNLARTTNMNMLRIWGGGVYESDLFYQLADELGILIWQDCAFASSMYPTREPFLESVRREINTQTRRLGSHASLVLIAGNNENEGNLASNYFGTGDDFDRYKADYVRLYIDTIKAEVERVLPHTLFVGSSPTNGLKSEQDGYVANKPNDDFYGDGHYYNYNADSWNFYTFPTPRFSSEFGYQSLPSLISWRTVTQNESSLHPLTGELMQNRQHHPDGNQQNIHLIENQMTLPDPEAANYLAAYIYQLQVTQAEATKTEIQHHRSFAKRLNDDGRGWTMGALYWQLNDVWIGPSWAGVDYLGRWKMLQYFVRQAFAPMVVMPRMTGEKALEVHVHVDVLPEDVPKSLSAMVHVYKYKEIEPVFDIMLPFEVVEGQSVFVESLDVANALFLAGCGAYDVGIKDCFFHFHVMDNDMTNEYTPRNYLFPEKLKNSNLGDADVSISDVVQVSDTEFDVTVTVDMVALFVWLETEIDGVFSDNGFVQTDPEQTVRFVADKTVKLDDLKASLTVTHLRDKQFL